MPTMLQTPREELQFVKERIIHSKSKIESTSKAMTLPPNFSNSSGTWPHVQSCWHYIKAPPLWSFPRRTQRKSWDFPLRPCRSQGHPAWENTSCGSWWRLCHILWAMHHGEDTWITGGMTSRIDLESQAGEYSLLAETYQAVQDWQGKILEGHYTALTCIIPDQFNHINHTTSTSFMIQVSRPPKKCPNQPLIYWASLLVTSRAWRQASFFQELCHSHQGEGNLIIFNATIMNFELTSKTKTSCFLWLECTTRPEKYDIDFQQSKWKMDVSEQPSRWVW